ncbi:MAG: CoA transferase, partial [Dehalococcoidia bacterium]|nr:CoA transferase [Dehalococcoidia bacterium]
ESKQLAAREFFVEIDHPAAGTFKYPTVPFRFSKSPHTSGIPAPCLGQHNHEIFCGRLGYDEGEMTKLAEAGVI